MKGYEIEIDTKEIKGNEIEIETKEMCVGG